MPGNVWCLSIWVEVTICSCCTYFGPLHESLADSAHNVSGPESCIHRSESGDFHVERDRVASFYRVVSDPEGRNMVCLGFSIASSLRWTF